MTTRKMTMNTRAPRIILSGGGTAGHIYPALSVADVLRGQGADVLFVGAEGRMEMERVPAAGYPIKGVPVAGLQRRLTVKNFAVPFKLIKSMRMARKIIRDFSPDVVAGFGGYASAPIVRAAQKAGIPTLIQEQNSYAGLTNRMLAKKAAKVCVAYEGMDSLCLTAKIRFTGNPLRGSFGDLSSKKAQAYGFFGLDPDKKTILVVGGSLGTRTLNQMMTANLDMLSADSSVQVIWQTGKYYAESLDTHLAGKEFRNIWRGAFIERMDYAYAIADVVISRAGASTVSELELLGKATIFVPSPNVAEDHQTKNAMSLVNAGAAVMIADSGAVHTALPAAIELLADDSRREEMAAKIKTMGKPMAARDVAEEIMKLAGVKLSGE